jgi:hypothetical protein
MKSLTDFVLAGDTAYLAGFRDLVNEEMKGMIPYTPIIKERPIIKAIAALPFSVRSRQFSGILAVQEYR